jgi:hypothetical protein
MIDVKKLITGFLILAVAAVCSGLIFSLVNLSPSVAATTTGGITIGGGTVADNTNAFLPTESQVEEVAAALAPGLASSTMFVSSTDSSNLTDNLATAFVNDVVAANPSGPTTDANGNPTFIPPDVNALAASITNTTTTQNVQIPNWDVEAESIPVTVIATSSATAMVSYASDLNDILVNHFENSQVESVLDNTDSASASDLVSMESQTQSALQDVASLKIPTPAKAYQKSLLAELVYEKNMLQLYTLSQTDPVKASIIFQQEDQNFALVQQNLQNQGNSLAINGLSLQQTPSNAQNKFFSLIYNIFAIQQANAQAFGPPPYTPPVPQVGLPVSNIGEGIQANIAANQSNINQVISNFQQGATKVQEQANATSLFGLISSIHVQNMGARLEALLKNTLLQILKNTLIAIIQREVLTWIQGSGAPRFITNWGTQLVNAAQTSAINAINAQMSCGVYPAFIPQIKVTLNAFYKPGGNACANQFAAALGSSNSLQQFYNNFASGGFVAFGASTLPSGNPYGQLFFSAQSVSLAYGNQQGASGLQAQASQGLGSSLTCANGSNPTTGTHVLCQTNGATTPDYFSSGSCNPGDTPVTLPNNGLCSDGSQPTVTTPAAATGFVLQSGIDATPKQLAAANDITGVLNAVLNSLLTGLASAAVNAVGQAVNQGLTSLNGSSITAAATTAAPAPIPLACSPSSQTAAPVSGTVSEINVSVSNNTATDTISNLATPSTTVLTSLSATGGTLDANNNEPIYYWSDDNGVTSTGASFSDTFANPGTYNVYLTDSTGDATSTCTVTVPQ